MFLPFSGALLTEAFQGEFARRPRVIFWLDHGAVIHCMFGFESDRHNTRLRMVILAPTGHKTAALYQYNFKHLSKVKEYRYNL